MACSNCSKIRCKPFGLVAGVKTTFNTGYYCGSQGSACYWTDHEGDDRDSDFGNDFATLPAFLKKLFKVAKLRLTGHKDLI